MDHQRNRRSSGDSALVGRDRWPRPPRTLRATRAGWCFIAIIFGVGFAALNTGNNLLYLVLALMLAFLVLSGLLSETSLRGLRIERSLPREIFALRPNRVILRIRNTQKRYSCFAIKIEDQLDSGEGTVPAGSTFALRVAAQSFVERSYLLEPSRRGDIRFSGFQVSTRFPFGLFVKARRLELVGAGIVYPQVKSVRVDTRRMPDRFEFEEIADASHDGDELSGLREFLPGDSQRRIHWRSSLRAGRLLVGEREGIASSEFEVRLHLPMNAAVPMIEERIAHAASEIVTHLDAGMRVGLRTAAMRFGASSGFAHRSELLTFLAHATPDAGPELRS